MMNKKGDSFFLVEGNKECKENTCLFSHKRFKHLNNTSNKNYNSRNISANADNNNNSNNKMMMY